jgi:hypothetical protein
MVKSPNPTILQIKLGLFTPSYTSVTAKSRRMWFQLTEAPSKKAGAWEVANRDTTVVVYSKEAVHVVQSSDTVLPFAKVRSNTPAFAALGLHGLSQFGFKINIKEGQERLSNCFNDAAGISFVVLLKKLLNFAPQLLLLRHRGVGASPQP